VGLTKAAEASKKAGPSEVQVFRVPTRKVAKPTQIQLYVRAGGRCEFAGCNAYLLEHHLTTTPGNFAQMAHIVAFSSGGPRAKESLSPAYVNDVSNLMLLCPPCHKLVDDHPKAHTVSRLRNAKAEHEERIRHVTGMSADLKTTVVRFTARVAGRTVKIPYDQVTKAVQPRYPKDTKGTVIDLTDFEETGVGFLESAASQITKTIGKLSDATLDGSDVLHVSVFALGPIPLLVHLGRELSDKVNVTLYQRHRDSEDWTWKSSGLPVAYQLRVIRQGTETKSVALCLSLSGPIDTATLPPNIDQRFTIYEITLVGQTPNPGFLRRAADLDEFAVTYQGALREIAQNHGSLDELHLFPAIPAPVAVHCGRALLPKIDPTLVVYDADKAKGGFNLTIRVN
jgi:hypothetical protein